MFDIRPADLADDLKLGKLKSKPRIIKIKDNNITKEKKYQLSKKTVSYLLSSQNSTEDIRGETIPNQCFQRKILRKKKKNKLALFLENKNQVPSYIEVNKGAYLKNKIKVSRNRPKLKFEHKLRQNFPSISHSPKILKESRIQSESNNLKEKNNRNNKPRPQAKSKESQLPKFKHRRSLALNPREEGIKRQTFPQPSKKVNFSIKKPRSLEGFKSFSANKIRRRQLPSKKRASLKMFFYNLKPATAMALSLFILFGLFYSLKFISYGYQKKDEITNKGRDALGHLAQAKTNMLGHDFENASVDITNAKRELEEAEKELDKIGGSLSEIFSQLPLFSKISTGKSVIEIGQEVAEAAENINKFLAAFSQLENPFDEKSAQGMSLGEVFLVVNEGLGKLKENVKNIEVQLEKISVDELPLEYQSKFDQAKKDFGVLTGVIAKIEENNKVFWDVLGYNGVRRYLFVFQNNQEMRATGGFIGSYGVLKIKEGEVENLFIEGIYNPDGQLKEKVVPPKPIQKISAAWSTHDANWFPNFPTSAEKIAWFYEKTGGPTVDGVITLTPNVLEELLEVTGPIEMRDYEVVINKENFIEKTQHEVEIDYDRELNQPKKFIADLTPIILNKVFSSKNSEDLAKTFSIISKLVKEKHILIYSLDHNIQKIISEQGWSGEVLQTRKDYLMVVNSNINGYKTDGVIDEYIDHEAVIQEDGSIISKVKIKRVHNGGHKAYDWWNKVNCDYMRVYVPKGSRLISVKGQTREFNQSPLNYDQLNFRRDPNIEQEEQNMEVDPESGTRIYEQDNKTVFANWVYVSPQEAVEIEYEYILPFQINFNKNKEKTDSYSILFQKQSGSPGSRLKSKIKLNDQSEILWKYPEVLDMREQEINFSSVLFRDKFMGVALQARN